MNYFYRAKNLRGQEVKGSLEAADEQELAKALSRRGYFLISATNSSNKAKIGKRIKNILSFDFLKGLLSVSLADKLFFSRNLTVMIRTGVPLPRAFNILSLQAKSKKFKKALETIATKVIKGDSLSKSLAGFPKIFPAIYQETIKVGEETGKLEQSLNMLANQMEREHALRSKIKTAMVYPAIVLCLAIGIGIFMFLFAVPKLKEAFDSLNVKLPTTTRAFLTIADFLAHYWPATILLGIIFIFLVIFLIRFKKGARWKSKLLLKIPIISKIIQQTNSVSTMYTLSSLMSAGVPVIRALNLTAGALNNYYFKKSLTEAAQIVEKGKKISEALEAYQDIYSPMVIEMLKVGEETGETSAVLEKLAEFYEQEVTNSAQKLSASIEPILIMMVGGGVGFFAISMMQPMFSAMGGIH